MADGQDRGKSRSACRHRGSGATQDQGGASAGGFLVRCSKGIFGTNLLEDNRVGGREPSGLRRPLRRTRRDRVWVCLDRNESETCQRDGGPQIRTRERCLSEELEFVRVHRPRDDQSEREEHDPQSHVVAKGRQDPFVRPDEGRPEPDVGKTARSVRGLKPGTSAPNRDEGQQPCIRCNPREDCRTRNVHRVAPRVRTRRTVTVSAGRHRQRVAPVSRSSAAERNPACRASASVMSERKARLASSMKRRPNSGPVSYRARTTYPTPGTAVPSEGRTTRRATAFRRRSPSSTEKVSSPRGRPRGNSPDRASRAAQITRNVTRPPMIRRFVKPIW